MVFGKHINRYYLKHLPALLLGVIALFLVDYNQLKIPKLYNIMVSGLNGEIENFDMTYLLENVCAPMIQIILLMAVGRFAWRVCLFGSAIKVEADLRLKMFDRCKDLSQQYYQVNKVGNLMSLFTADLETINECFGDGVLMVFDALLLGGIAIYNMWDKNKMLTILSLIPMLCMFVIGTLVGKTMMKKWDARQQAYADLSDFTQENFSGIAVVKAFVKEFRELWAFKKLNKQNENANLDFTRTSTLLHIFVTLFVESVMCIIIGYGGWLVNEGVFQAGDLIEFYGYFGSVVWPVIAISQLIDMSSRGKASLKRISDLLDAEVNVLDKEGVEALEHIRGDIEFRNLTFTYPGTDCEVLKNVSFNIKAGENVGIIGKTGSGKTTIVDLILRIYNVPDGTVFVDGRDVNTIPIKNLRDFAAYVPQDNFLFSDTIKNNIGFAQDSRDYEDIIRVAKMSDVHENIIGFKEGYETTLGERGVTVSGGQKQRISIARALYKEASILILDDSVSAVDTDTEKVIIGNLRENRKGRTTILIAHRISTVEKMDKIIYIDDGRIGAVGTHEELIATRPDYKTMVELQKLEEEREV